MSFTKFFEKDTQQSYPIKILVYPNITYMQDLEKDSYVVVLRNVIKELNEVRDDLHWTIISPSEIQSLIFPNTKQLLLPMPSYPNAMRTHFDFTSIKPRIMTGIDDTRIFKNNSLYFIKFKTSFLK